MQCNVGTVDRILRVVVGLAIASLAFVGPQNLWYLLGLIPVATGMVGWCPLYSLLKINTRKGCVLCKDEKKPVQSV
jgi:hypothetical protein